MLVFKLAVLIGIAFNLFDSVKKETKDKTAKSKVLVTLNSLLFLLGLCIVIDAIF